MNDIYKINNRPIPPVPWDEGDNIPWNAPGFSERMLKEHLSQDHDLASRKNDKVADHTRWIFETLMHSKPSRVLDLACGPGLYTSALAKRGCACLGLDFSPASIRHATRTAIKKGLDCTYRLADLREGNYGSEFNLAMLIYGQINVFKQQQAKDILKEMFSSLSPGGTALLEPQTYEQVYGNGQETNSWYSAPAGLFSNEPHLVLQEGYWDEKSSTRTERFHIIDAVSGKTTIYAMPSVAYTADEFVHMMQDAGFTDIRSHSSLDGEKQVEPIGTQLFVGTRTK